MKINCNDGLSRDFNYAFDYFVRSGFDPGLIAADRGLLQITMSPHLGFTDALSLASKGVAVPNCFQHFSRRSKKRNSQFVMSQDFLKNFKWIALTPSIKYFNEYQVNLNMGLLTIVSRILTSFWDFFNLRRYGRDSFPYYVKGIEKEDFKYSQGYKIIGYIHESKAGGWIVAQNGDSQIFINDSLLGYTQHIYLSEED